MTGFNVAVARRAGEYAATGGQSTEETSDNLKF